ncbi:MAG: hypothetical protein FJW31_06180 [Acidobacteria bacterium]|nr:hypothetical protein [Acidobacteriota bacterium]
MWTTRRVEYFKSLPASAPGRQRYDEYMLSPRATDEGFLGLVADTLYADLKAAVAECAPRHLFFGERFVLRQPPETVLRAVGKHVDAFLMQALILSPHRPPEWQTFQRSGYDRDHALTGGKPMIIVDKAAPFHLDGARSTKHGELRH